MAVEWWSNAAGFPGQGNDFGVLTKIDSWIASRNKRRWLLISGAMNPPQTAAPTAKVRADGERSGNFLAGIDLDFYHMSRVIGGDLHNKVQDMEIKVKGVEAHIKKFFEMCQKNEYVPMLYYTGHGAAGSGDWCFADGKLSFSAVHDLLPGGTFYPWVFVDCCYSGHWANLARAKYDGKLRVVAATPYFMTALDDPEEGGHFTSYITGKKRAETLQRPMVCSGFPEKDHPLPNSVATYRYSDRLKGELSFGERFVMAQHFYDDKCAFVLGTLLDHNWGARPSAWCTRDTYDGLSDWVREQWNHGFNVMHCSCGKRFFGAYAVKGWGTMQSFAAGKLDHVKEFITGKWNDGWSITSICPGIKHDWVVFVTKCEGDHLHGNSKGSQAFHSSSSWNTARDAIQENWKKGKVVTAVAVSKGVWFISFIESPRAQRFVWGPADGSFPNTKENCWDKGLELTAILKDPSDGRWLVIATGGLKATNVRWNCGILI